MNTRIRAVCLLAALVPLVPQHVTAQGAIAQRSSNLAELDPDDPRAKRASTLATLLLGSDAKEAERYLTAHAAPGSEAARNVPTLIKDLRAAVKAGFVVDRVMAGADDDVMVQLSDPAGSRAGRMGLRMQIERDAPHRIREVRAATPRRVQRGGL